MTSPVPSKPLQFAAWTILAAAILVTAWGVWTNGLFAQPMWEPAGLLRLGLLAGGYAIWVAAVLFTRPGWFAPATLALTLLFTILSTGLLPVLAVLLFLGSSYLLGALLLGDRELLALPLGIAVWMAVIGVAAHFPVNCPWVYVPVLLIPFAVKPGRTRACLRDCARAFAPLRLPRRPDHALAALAAFPVLCHLLVAIKPEAGTDALAVHLALPARVALLHYWPFDFQHVAWSVMPLGADWCYTAVYLLGGEFAARLLNFSLLVLLVVMVYAASRRFLAPGPAALCAGLLATTPLVQLVTGSLLVENMWAVLLVGVVLALDRFRETLAPRWLYAAAVLMGAGLATKFGSTALALPAGAFAAWVLLTRREQIPGAARVAAAAIVLILLFGAPPYVYAYVKTGNPVFPFLNQVFQSRWFDASRNLSDPRYQTPLRFGTPYDVVFHTRKYLEGHDGALGFQYLLLAPLALLVFFRRAPALARLALATAAVFSVLTFSGVSYVRYLYPALPLIAVAGAAAWAQFADSRALFRTTLAALLGAFVLNLYFLPAAGWYHAGFFLNPFNRAEVERYYSEQAPVRKLVEYMNRNHPGAPVAFFSTSDVAELKAPAYVLNWMSPAYSQRVWLMLRPSIYGRYAQSLGISYFIAPSDVAERELWVIRSFLAGYTEREYAAGRFELRRVQRDAAARWAHEDDRTVMAPCDAAMIDDTAPHVRYSGTWRHIKDFGEACGRTLAYTDVAGAEASIDFTGTSITYVYTKAFTRGIGEVFIDGVSRGLLDQYSAGIEWRTRAIYGGLAPGKHTLTIRVLHRRSKVAQADDVDIDGFVAAP